MSSVETQTFFFSFANFMQPTKLRPTLATRNRRFGPGILIYSILYSAANITHFGKFSDLAKLYPLY